VSADGSVPPILDSEQALAEAAAALARLDPVMARLLAEGVKPILRKREAGFEALAAIIVGQQVSTASAAAIFARLEATLPPSPEAIAAASDVALRSAGLSGPKIRALRSLAVAVLDGVLPLDALHERKADEAHGLLVAVKGIGPWTADVYLLFCLGHADAFPAGDLALQEAARLAYRFQARPKARDLVLLAERWQPWRGVAAKMLWSYYRTVKAREGAPVGA
jgi:DNA-3-methyladenine glycosylase II